jgi:DtxR family transcriptional regulator, Mn-dependent transcriptional regulator
MESERIEEYLEAIYKEQEKETPVSTSALARDLKVSLPAVTDMLRRLESEGFIEYTANKGATLTSEGNKKALSVVRRHRLWERFLTDILGIKWDRVHEEACRLEHATSPETEKKLASLLGNVDTCPHGYPIPGPDGNMKEQELVPLSDLGPGQSACIETIAEETPKLLREIARLGLKPKTVVTIESRNDDGSVLLKTGSEQRTVRKETASLLLARQISGEPDSPEELPVSGLGAGESGIVKSCAGDPGAMGRCLAMGVTPGSNVKMVRNFGSGPVLIKVHDAELALGREIAGKIVVTRSGESTGKNQ